MDDVIELSFDGSVREKVRKLLTSQTPAKPIDAPTAAQTHHVSVPRAWRWRP
jgi:hypothetical protein